MFVVTKVHVILRRSRMLTWVHDKNEIVQHVTMDNTKSQLCNDNYNDNGMHVSVWFEFFGGLF